MKIALICPSNMLYMPYVDNYEVILKANEINYTIVNWDRFSIEKESEFIYRDKKIGHQRNYFDYYKYYRFVLKILKNNRFDKVIVFGLQMAYFLNKYLIKNYKGNYIIDIRDYNKIIKIFNPAKIIKNSAVTVISSPGYKQWLPESKKYIVNHNTIVSSIHQLRDVNRVKNYKKIIISYIGSLTNYDVNIAFIKSLKNINRFQLQFYGDGIINKDLQNYIENSKISNVSLSGRYERHEELRLYANATLINMVLYNDHINNRTCLANRLYNSALYGKPMIALEGTYLSEIIKQYNLGVILKSFNNTEEGITNYLANFNLEEYNYGRKAFFEKVIEENQYFRDVLYAFIT